MINLAPITDNNMSTLEKTARMSDITPFGEEPSVNSRLYNQMDRTDELAATDLFSLFTADIIREQVLFTR